MTFPKKYFLNKYFNIPVLTGIVIILISFLILIGEYYDKSNTYPQDSSTISHGHKDWWDMLENNKELSIEAKCEIAKKALDLVLEAKLNAESAYKILMAQLPEDKSLWTDDIKSQVTYASESMHKIKELTEFYIQKYNKFLEYSERTQS